MSLARLKAASLGHVEEVLYNLGGGSWKLDADPERQRHNERGLSYVANYNESLVLVGRKIIPSRHNHSSHEHTLKRLMWQLKFSEDIKELRILPCLGYSYEYSLRYPHIRHKVIYSIHGKDAISLRDMLRAKNIDHFRLLPDFAYYAI
ncbi:hypothetical protein KXX44_009459 [Aspergillus fumigatus]|nr:hypothetical protein KXX44_009459 [Aspergillus fumigatus]KAH1843020.1 hypothetical protein KXX55_003518 [Aspergillus fumigatus]KAH2977085.1 hypothetical protein KXW58_006086 [Aspergillus fumigatus]KAH3319257.1 hypothetical protein KXW17_009169 [Aspergillus fumigatus]